MFLLKIIVKLVWEKLNTIFPSLNMLNTYYLLKDLKAFLYFEYLSVRTMNILYLEYVLWSPLSQTSHHQECPAKETLRITMAYQTARGGA